MTPPSLSVRCWQTAICSIAASVSMLVPAGLALAQPREFLELVQTMHLPDVRGRIDHLDIDLAGDRLFVAALGNNTVEVIDLRAGRRSARLEHLQEPQGVAYAPDTNRLFVASGRGGRVDVFAGDSLAPTGRVDGLEDADNIRYEGPGGRIYVGYGTALAAIDAARRRLFVATRQPAALLVYDAETGKRVADLPIGDDADDVFYDPERKRIYVICGQGVIEVIGQDDADRYQTLAHVRSAAGARTGLFVAARNALYVAVPARAGSAAEVRIYAVP